MKPLTTISKAWGTVKVWVYALGIVGAVTGGTVKAVRGYDNIILKLEKLTDIQSKQDAIASKVDSLAVDFDTFKGEEEEDIKALTQSVNQVDRNLHYYIRHSGDMTTQQILEAFELGQQAEKKKNSSQPTPFGWSNYENIIEPEWARQSPNPLIPYCHE